MRRNVTETRGISGHVFCYHVSDYGKTIAKYGMDKPDVWAELAHDWLDDKDSADGKTEIYYREIVDK